MANGRSALATVLFACAAVSLLLTAPVEGGGGGIAAADDVPPHLQPSASSSSWCLKKECKCTVAGAARRPSNDNVDTQRQVSVRCTYTGEQNVTLQQDENLTKSLVELVLSCDGQCRLTIEKKKFVVYNQFRSFAINGFAEVRIKRQGLCIRNELRNFAVNISGVRTLTLETNAVQPTGTVDILIENCGVVRLESEVIANLRSFVFRRIDSLELSENTFMNTFKNATSNSSVIEKMILENLTADKLPSNAFKTTIDQLSITNCKFDSIEPKAFPVMSVENVTFTNVTVDLVMREAFQPITLITNLRIIGCHFGKIEENAIKSVVQKIYIERSEFQLVSTSAVTVSTELTLYNNRFERVAARGFVLNSLHVIRVNNNTFVRLEPEAFYESTLANRQDHFELHVRDNEFAVDSGVWSPVVRLLRTANETNVTGNRFIGSASSCSCGPWRFVAVAINGNSTSQKEEDYRFSDRNYCKTNALGAKCANLTTVATGVDQEFLISVFTKAAGCGSQKAEVYNQCVKEQGIEHKGFRFFGFSVPDQGIITFVVFLILCGFGAVCTISAITWLNARGYFIKLRSLFTNNGTGRDGTGRNGMMSRTMSAHSLSPMSVHEYAELQRNKLGGSGGNMPTGSDVGAVRMIVFQDKGTQTVPEELTHEMLQTLRNKLDDPEDYAEARGMIEHLYDLIRVEETCCRGGGWYSVGGLDDMTSTITTKAVAVDLRGRDLPERDVKSVGTGAPSLDRLWPPKINVQSPRNRDYRPVKQQQRPPPPRPSVGEYMDPADLYGTGRKRDDDGDNYSDMDIYCELADLGGDTGEYMRPQSRAPTPPPVPNKPTEI